MDLPVPPVARSVSIEVNKSGNRNADQYVSPGRRRNVYSRSVSLRNGYHGPDWAVASSASQSTGNRSTDNVSSSQSLAGAPFFLTTDCLPIVVIENFETKNEDAVYSQFTKCHTCYDLVPTSTKLVVFDTQLSVKKAFYALVEHGVRAAPLWESSKKQFVGMLTITDFIHMLRRYYKSGVVGIKELEEHKITTWREVLTKDDMLRPLITIDAKQSVYEAVKTLCHWTVHRLPIMDPLSGNVLYILTAKKILRFLYVYIRDLPSPSFLHKTPRELEIGCWQEIHTLREDTKLIDALSYFLDKRVSALPVISDDKGQVVAVYAKMDVFHLAADKSYNNLDITVKEALTHRADNTEGLTICKDTDSLATILRTFVEEKAHRVVIVNDELRVTGMISLSDVLAFLVLRPQSSV